MLVAFLRPPTLQLNKGRALVVAGINLASPVEQIQT
jgi:hypothetical protein